MKNDPKLSRRQLAQAIALLGLAPGALAAAMRTREIPDTGEELPVIGLGTYSVFDVAPTAEDIELRRRIIEALGDAGGAVIDTSPMYNRSEAVIGEVFAQDATIRPGYFLATKVWTDGRAAGERQMRESAGLMKTRKIDLMQVHNRRDMDAHWPTIMAFQESGFVRYNGVTDYRASAIEDLLAIMRRYRPQFIQINYSLGERDAERRLLPAARDAGVAVLVNRPFVAGRLFRAVGDRQLPDWASEFAASWGQFFLKYIVSHPAVTAAIPATSKLRHMVDNAGAGTGPLPDAATRRRMAQFVDDL